MAESNPYFSSLLNKIAIAENYINAQINVASVSSGGANFTAILYRIKITSKNKPELNLFAKIGSFDENIREHYVMNIFAVERFWYMELAKVYNQLEDKYKLNEDKKLVIPKFYDANSTCFQEILVLEDLIFKGFNMHSRHEPISWQYATAAIRELVKFHTLSFVYQQEKPKEFEKVTNMLEHGKYTSSETNQKYFEMLTSLALQSVRHENKERLQSFINGIDSTTFSRMLGVLDHPVIIHGNFKTANMLYRLRNNGAMELVVIDYQTLQTSGPLVDLFFFIFTATDGAFRSKHYQKLLDYYHSELSASLNRFDLNLEDIYSKAAYEYEVKEKLPYGLLVSILWLPFVLMSADSAPSLSNKNNMDILLEPPGVNYIQRLNEVVDDFVSWGVLV